VLLRALLGKEFGKEGCGDWFWNAAERREGEMGLGI